METDLHKAARAGSEAQVAQWLRLNGWFTTRLDNGNADGHTALMLAVLAGSVGCVDQLLSAGVKVDVADPRGYTALSHAATHGHVVLVDRLLGRGAKADHVNRNGSSPLMLAASVGNTEVVERLLAAQVDVNQLQKGTLDTALTFAASKGHADIVMKLVVAGAKVNLLNKSGNTALLLAARKGYIDVVKLLIRAGANVNVVNNSGATALSLAVENGREEVVCELLAGGPRKLTMTSQQAEEVLTIAQTSEAATQAVFTAATRGQIPELLGAIDHHVITRQDGALLHRAFKLGRLDMATLLLERGASPSAPDFSGSSPLHCAVIANNLEAIVLLVKHRADLDAQDVLGETPLTLAAAAGRVDLVQQLLDAGADIDGMNYRGQSALTITLKKGNENVLSSLLAAGVGLKMTNAQIEKAVTDAKAKGHQGVVDLLEQFLDPAVVFFAAIQRGDIVTVTATVEEYKNARTEHDRTALQVAVQAVRVEIVELLLQRGANVEDFDDSGKTALHYAAVAENVAIVRLLVANGADIYAQDDKGETPLLQASKAGDAVIVQVLLQHGARADVASHRGQTPLSSAGSEEVRSVLQLYHNRDQYQAQCLKLLTAVDTKPTDAELLDLVPLITSVYDLRQLLSLVSLTYGKETDDANATKRAALVKTALQHIVASKLVFDDDACVFFKVVLDHCKAHAWLPTGDIHMLDRQAEKVNTESAEWVVELQRKVHDHSWRLDAHEQGLRRVADGITHVHKMVHDNRTAIKAAHSRVGQLQTQVDVAKKLMGKLVDHGNQLSDDVQRLQERIALTESNVTVVAERLQSFNGAVVARQNNEKTTKTVKSFGGILASVAGYLLAPEFEDLINGVVDLADAQQIVDLTCNSSDMVALLADEASEHVFKPTVEHQLEKLMIPKDEFKTLLREEIALQHPELVEECVKRGLSVGDLGVSGETDNVKAVESSLTNEANGVSALISELEKALKEAAAKRDAMEVTKRLQHGFRNHQAARPSFELSVNKPVEGTGSSARKISGHSEGKASTVDIEAGQQIVLVGDADAFPFHTAVQESEGQLDEFKELVEMLAGDSDDPSAAMPIEFRSVSASQEALCAAEYAYMLGYRVVGDLLAARMTGETDKSATEISLTKKAVSVELLEADDDFAYISIVNECAGDAEECEDMCDTIEDDGHAIDARIQAKVVRESSVAVNWTAAEYAAHLGYVEIVRLLLKQWSPNVSAKDKIQLLKQAKERAKTVEAAAIA